jgi:hypothetical protein
MDNALRSRWMFRLLFVVQTIGVVMIYWNALPLYRDIRADKNVQIIVERSPAWALVAIAIVQIAYWSRFMLRPAVSPISNPLLGHVIMFVARMGFTFATAVFSFAFVAQDVHLPLDAAIVTIGALFSIFCYTQELDFLGRTARHTH